jgi:ribosomal protein S18 acetylase RimI-like enzyme
MDAPYTLRQATTEDYDFLYDLNRQCLRVYIEAIWGWHDEWQEEYFRRKFDPAPRQIIQVDGHDVGVVVVEERPDELYVALIELLPAYQGHGIGTRIVTELRNAAHGAGRPLSLHVLRSNEPARRLYERLGFRVVETTAERYRMSCPPA